ncbi:MAG: hypothetical protein ABIR15_02260 [Chitinophagaceae bacterium]
MKKLVLFLLAILALSVAAVYYLIPDTLVVTELVKVNCVSDAAFRNLSNEQNWSKWWPGPKDTGNAAAGKSFLLSDNRYSLSKKTINNFEILIDNKKDILSSEMNLLSLPGNAMLIKWHYTATAGSNFFNRIAAYRKALSLKKDMHTILDYMQTYLSDFKNIYGFTFHEASTIDTFLITTKAFSPGWPATDFVYDRINKLKKFCNEQGCNITGTPMLNITRLQSSGYQLMVALPVNRFMQPKDSISGIRMVPGKFIIADVAGGLQTIAEMHQQISFYFQDYRRTSMAIPFDYLVTDRQRETDSSKWITRIYAPVY